METRTEEMPVREVVDGTGKRKLTIHRRASGTFYFEEWKYSDKPREMCWIPLPCRYRGIYDSLETALQEAAARLPWFGQSQTDKEENLS